MRIIIEIRGNSWGACPMQCEPLAIIDSQLEVNRKKNLDEILGGKS